MLTRTFACTFFDSTTVVLGVNDNAPSSAGPTSLACAVQSPDERPDRDAVDVQDVPSVLSHQNIRINGFQFAARIVDVHLPIHAPLTPVDIGGPGGDFAAKSLEVAETATAEALACHGAQLAFRDVQPASVLGGVTEHDAANQRPLLAAV